MTMKINLPLIATVLMAVAGAAGTVLVPIFGSGLSSAVAGVLQGLAALLLAIPTYHVSSVAAYTAKARAMARLNAESVIQPQGSALVH